MKLSLLVPIILLGASCNAYAQSPTPRMAALDHKSAKAGDVIAVTGTNLDKAVVAKVFLTDGKNDTAVEVVEQNATTIKFKVPSNVAVGRVVLMVLTAGKDAVYIEEPVKLNIDAE